MAGKYDHHWKKGGFREGDKLEIPSERDKAGKAKQPRKGRKKKRRENRQAAVRGWGAPTEALPAWVPADMAARVNEATNRVRMSAAALEAAEPDALRILERWRVVPKKSRAAAAAEYANALRQRPGGHADAIKLEAYVRAADERERAVRSLKAIHADVARCRQAAKGSGGHAPPPAPAVPDRDAQEAADAAGREARTLGDECRAALKAYGREEPRSWSQGELRGLIRTLRSDGSPHEAIAVERYADARVEWAKAIEAAKAGRQGPAPKAAPPTGGADAPIPVARWRSGWIGKPPGPPEPWHRTTPPWEDSPRNPACPAS